MKSWRLDDLIVMACRSPDASVKVLEKSVARTQEFTLRWSPEREQTCREIVRQPWNFSPSGSMVEIEDYRVNLLSVAVFELIIDPGCESQAVFASMKRM